jgi:glyoxylase-like metal-dependent hydrolase (beta-lactamase superfamily II)
VPNHNGLEIVTIPAGPIETNAFLVIDRATNDALVIDAPPDLLDLLERQIAAHGAKPVALVITHAHWDHIGDAATVRDALGVPLLAHEREQRRIEHPAPGPEPIPGAPVDRVLTDGDSVELGGHTFEVWHTPGHSPGQMSLISAPDNLMLGGDTLFPNGYGRVDIPGASEDETIATIRRLLALPDAVVVYPGHGLPTTIGRERAWMQQVDRTGRLLG